MADAMVNLARANAILFSKLRRGQRALIIPPAANGSLGDAAMITGTEAVLRTEGFKQIDILCDAGWAALPNFDRYMPADDYFYHGNRRTGAAVMAKLGRYSHALFLGADVVDGAYSADSVIRRLGILDLVARIGGKASVLGCSFNEHPDPRCVEALKSLPQNVRICARDPISRARMVECIARPVANVADLAFLVEPKHTAPDARDAIAWIAQCRNAKRRIIALNANSIMAKKFPGYQTGLLEVARALTDRGVAIVTVPHDMRNDRPDAIILREIIEALPDESREHTYQLQPESPGAVKAVLEAVDLVVTGRMHVAILAMGACTPALSFGYQGKFEGLLELLDLRDEETLFPPTILESNSQFISDQIFSLLGRRDNLKEKLDRVIPLAKQKAMHNFADFIKIPDIYRS